MQSRFLLISAAFAMAAPAASAGDSFDNSHIITSAALAATVTNSSVYFAMPGSLYTGNTIITDGAFKETTGVVAILQNSGLNSIAQQAVAVRMGTFVMEFSQ